MDGLLLDSERAIRDAWLSVAQSNGVALSEAAYLQVIGRNAADSRAILEKTFCGAYDEARRTAQALLDETMLEQGYAVKPGVFELLTDLRARTCVREPACENLRARGVDCCVASSTHALCIAVLESLEQAVPLCDQWFAGY